jgi:5-methylcytosine-specific restriction endonuclease McrA
MSSADVALARRVRQEEPQCRDCGAPTEVAGHIRPHAYGGQYVRSNLKGQCNKCNNAQIATDRVKYRVV